MNYLGLLSNVQTFYSLDSGRTYDKQPIRTSSREKARLNLIYLKTTFKYVDFKIQ